MAIVDFLAGGYIAGSMIGDRRANKREAAHAAALQQQEDAYRSQMERVARDTLNSQLRQERMIWEGTPQGRAYLEWRPRALKTLEILEVTQSRWNQAWFDHFKNDPASKVRRRKLVTKSAMLTLLSLVISIAMLWFLFIPGALSLVVDLFKILGSAIGGESFDPTAPHSFMDSDKQRLLVVLSSIVFTFGPLLAWWKMLDSWASRSSTLNMKAYDRKRADGPQIDPDNCRTLPAWDMGYKNNAGMEELRSKLHKAAYAFPTYTKELPSTQLEVGPSRDDFPPEINALLEEFRTEVRSANL